MKRTAVKATQIEPKHGEYRLQKGIEFYLLSSGEVSQGCSFKKGRITFRVDEILSTEDGVTPRLGDTII